MTYEELRNSCGTLGIFWRIVYIMCLPTQKYLDNYMVKKNPSMSCLTTGLVARYITWWMWIFNLRSRIFFHFLFFSISSAKPQSQASRSYIDNRCMEKATQTIFSYYIGVSKVDEWCIHITLINQFINYFRY